MTQNMENSKNMVQILPVAGGGVGPRTSQPALAGPEICFNSFRAFWSDFCPESVRGPLNYPTILIAKIEFRLKWRLNRIA